MADDFADMFTYRGSIREEDIIDISDEEEEEIEAEFETLSKKRSKQPKLTTPKKLKTSSENRNISDSNSSNNSKTLSISIDDDDDDEISFVNNSSNNSNKNNNSNNNNKINNVFSLDDDDDDDDDDLKPHVYKKTNFQSLLKQNSNLNNNSSSNIINKTPNNKYSSNNNNNGFYNDNIYGSSPNISSSPQPEKKKNDGIPLVIKLAGEPNEKIIFYYDTEIQKLLELYCGKKNLDPKSAQFKLYGLALDSKKTPRELNLIDDDELEVTIKVTEPLKNLDEITTNTNTTESNSSAAISVDDDTPKVILKVTYEKQTHKFKIGMSDPFSKLISGLSTKIGGIPAGKKIVLRFDGMSLSPTATPESEDMEDDFIIEALLK